MRAVLGGAKTNPPPRAELWVAPAVLASEGLPNTASGVAALAARLGSDLCFLSCSGPQAVTNDAASMRAAVEAVHAGGLACGAVVDGPWQRLTQAEGLESALRRLAADVDTEQRIAALAQPAQLELAAWDAAGADLIMLADDMAYDGGPYFSPTLFDRLLVSHYRRLAPCRPTASGPWLSLRRRPQSPAARVGASGLLLFLSSPRPPGQAQSGSDSATISPFFRAFPPPG